MMMTFENCFYDNVHLKRYDIDDSKHNAFKMRIHSVQIYFILYIVVILSQILFKYISCK